MNGLQFLVGFTKLLLLPRKKAVPFSYPPKKEKKKDDEDVRQLSKLSQKEDLQSKREARTRRPGHTSTTRRRPELLLGSKGPQTRHCDDKQDCPRSSQRPRFGKGKSSSPTFSEAVPKALWSSSFGYRHREQTFRPCYCPLLHFSWQLQSRIVNKKISLPKSFREL